MNQIGEVRDNDLSWGAKKVKHLTVVDSSMVSPTYGQMTAHQEGTQITMTSTELDAKLETIEARMDGRVVELAGKIDGYLGRMEERDKRNDERAANFASSLADMKSELHETRGEMKLAIGSMKTTVITTGIGSVLAIVFGIAAFNATVLSNMVASFESGKSTATAVGEATKRLEQLQDRIEAQQKQVTAPPPK